MIAGKAKISQNKILKTLSLAVIAAGLGACALEPATYSHFCHIDRSVWYGDLPLRFSPALSDSSTTYDLMVAIRHNRSFPYSSLPVAIDFIDDTFGIASQSVIIPLADEQGQWLGSGMGDSYQTAVHVRSGLSARQLHNVVIWPTLEGRDSIVGIDDVGIIASPVKSHTP